MKVKIKNETYEMEIMPRELTAVLISKDEEIRSTDNAFMLFHCPYPTKKKDLDNIKKKAISKAEDNYEELKRYLECNKTLHKGDDANENV